MYKFTLKNVVYLNLRDGRSGRLSNLVVIFGKVENKFLKLSFFLFYSATLNIICFVVKK